MSSAEQESSDTDTGVPTSSTSASNPSTTGISSPSAPSSSEEEQHTTSLTITSSGDNSGADPALAAQPGGEQPADRLQHPVAGNGYGGENEDDNSSDTEESDNEDDAVPGDREELLGDRHDRDQHGPCHRFTLIPPCAVRHWKCSCASCTVLLGTVVVLVLALVGGTIFWVVEANQRSHQSITLSTYKEVFRLSSTTDHLFLEKACISVSKAPPYSTEVTIGNMDCSPPKKIDKSFHFQGMLLPGLESTQQTQLVDHDLVFYWHKGTHIKLVTQPIPFYRAGEVTIFLLIDEVSFMDCAVDHIQPKEGTYVEQGKWSVKPDSPQCHMSKNSSDFSCKFNYTVTQSNMYYICFYRTEIAMLPSLHTYAYELKGDLQSYDTRLFHHCNLSLSNQACCASYGSVFSGLLNKTCIFVKTDLTKDFSARQSTDLGAVFTVTVSSSVRFSVIWLSVGLTIVCVIIAFVLMVLCVATIDRGRNGNERRRCHCMCRT